MADLQQRINYSEGGFPGFGRWQAMLPEKPNHVYCTNEEGEGLFIIRLDNGAVEKIKGLREFMPRDFVHFKQIIEKMWSEWKGIMASWGVENNEPSVG